MMTITHDAVTPHCLAHLFRKEHSPLSRISAGRQHRVVTVQGMVVGIVMVIGALYFL